MRIADSTIGVSWPAMRAFALAAVLPLALGACASDEVRPADAQNPMGDNATAAIEDGGGSPAGAPAGPTAYRFGSSANEATACLQRHEQRTTQAAAALRADSAARRPSAGQNPLFAEENGWYPDMPAFMDGSILPCSRIIAYYGHPKSTRMGALGEFPKEEMLRRFRAQI